MITHVVLLQPKEEISSEEINTALKPVQLCEKPFLGLSM